MKSTRFEQTRQPKISVFLRVKPGSHIPSCIQIEPSSVSYSTEKYSFDNIIQISDQLPILKCHKNDLCNTLANGGHFAVIAYGASKAGKTYSIIGDGGKNKGLIHLSLEQAIAVRNSVVTLSLIEISNDCMKDLTTGKPCRYDRTVDTFTNLTTRNIVSLSQGISLIEEGLARIPSDDSCQAPTHVIIQIRVLNAESLAVLAVISLFDLAAASPSTGNSDDLDNLSNVLDSLHNGEQHVPYRESELTSLLKPYLTNGLTSFIIHVDPGHSEATGNALKFSAACDLAKKSNMNPAEPKSSLSGSQIRELEIENNQLKEKVRRISEQAEFLAKISITQKQTIEASMLELNSIRNLKGRVCEHYQQNENEKLRTAMATFEAFQSESDARCKGYVVQIRELNDEKRKLQSDLEGSKAEITDFKAQVAQMSTTLEELTNEVESTKANFEEKSRKYKQLKQQSREFNQVGEKITEANGTLESKIADLEEEVAKLKEKAQNNEKVSKDKITKLESDKLTAQIEIQKLTTQAAIAANEMQSLKSQESMAMVLKKALSENETLKSMATLQEKNTEKKTKATSVSTIEIESAPKVAIPPARQRKKKSATEKAACPVNQNEEQVDMEVELLAESPSPEAIASVKRQRKKKQLASEPVVLSKLTKKSVESFDEKKTEPVKRKRTVSAEETVITSSREVLIPVIARVETKTVKEISKPDAAKKAPTDPKSKRRIIRVQKVIMPKDADKFIADVFRSNK